MDIALVYGGVPGHDAPLAEATRIITDTLAEFDDCVMHEIRPALLSLPFYNGTNADIAAVCAKTIAEARGVIFAAEAALFGLTAPTVQLLDYLTDSRYAGLLTDKNCLITVVSGLGGERAAADALSATVAFLRGFDAGRIMIGQPYLATLSTDENYKAMIERQVEDYYRVIRQNRKFFIPSFVSAAAPPLASAAAASDTDTPSSDFAQTADEAPKRPKVEDIYTRHTNAFRRPRQNLGAEQEAEISEITKLFAKKYATADDAGVLVEEGEKPLPLDYTDAAPREKTCYQLTKNLPRYFKPQMAGGFKAVIQLVVTAKNPSDGFEGYLTIDGGACTYQDGQAAEKDITIMSGEKAWLDVLKGKQTAQKAFMIGQLKVRGNFLLLSKMDQIFQFSMAADTDAFVQSI